MESNRHAPKATKSTEKSASTAYQMLYTQGALDTNQVYNKIFDVSPNEHGPGHAGIHLEGGAEYICDNHRELTLTILCELEGELGRQDRAGSGRDPQSLESNGASSHRELKRNLGIKDRKGNEYDPRSLEPNGASIHERWAQLMRMEIQRQLAEGQMSPEDGHVKGQRILLPLSGCGGKKTNDAEVSRAHPSHLTPVQDLGGTKLQGISSGTQLQLQCRPHAAKKADPRNLKRTASMQAIESGIPMMRFNDWVTQSTTELCQALWEGRLSHADFIQALIDTTKAKYGNGLDTPEGPSSNCLYSAFLQCQQQQSGQLSEERDTAQQLKEKVMQHLLKLRGAGTGPEKGTPLWHLLAIMSQTRMKEYHDDVIGDSRLPATVVDVIALANFTQCDINIYCLTVLNMRPALLIYTDMGYNRTFSIMLNDNHFSVMQGDAHGISIARTSERWQVPEDPPSESRRRYIHLLTKTTPGMRNNHHAESYTAPPGHLELHGTLSFTCHSYLQPTELPGTSSDASSR